MSLEAWASIAGAAVALGAMGVAIFAADQARKQVRLAEGQVEAARDQAAAATDQAMSAREQVEQARRANDLIEQNAAVDRLRQDEHRHVRWRLWWRRFGAHRDDYRWRIQIENYGQTPAEDVVVLERVP